MVKKTVAKYPQHPLILVGKSMGSRVGCMVAAENDIEASVVVCLGYPLKGTKGTIRDKPLLQLTVPTMFVQVRSDWESVKTEVMYKALRCKFSIYPHLKSMLLSTSGCVLVEASPYDLFWGGGRDGEGLNYLGRLLMKLRSEFLGDETNKPEFSAGYAESQS